MSVFLVKAVNTTRPVGYAVVADTAQEARERLAKARKIALSDLLEAVPATSEAAAQAQCATSKIKRLRL